MTSHRKQWIVLGGAAVACLAATVSLIGCGSSTPQQQVVAPPPAPPPPPPKPKVTPIDQLMVQLGIDERVRLPEDKAPETDEARRAVLEFFDAFARSDATAVGAMLSVLDRLELEELARSGAWQATTSQITRIDVQTGASPAGEPCALAVFYVAAGFQPHQPQLWYYTTDMDGATFDAVAAPPGIIDRLSGPDWIAVWFEILEQELAMADQPDEEFVVPQKDYSDSRRGGSVGPSNPQGPNRGPSAPPSVPGKRPKPKTPRRPPGPPG